MVRLPFFKETNNITDALLFVFLSVFAPQLRLLLRQRQSETGSCGCLRSIQLHHRPFDGPGLRLDPRGYVQEATTSDFWNMQMTLRYCTQRRPKDLPGRSKNPSASEEVLPQLQMHGEDVESVTSFTHLGSTITNDANPTPEINRRCPLVARCHANSPGATVATSLHLQSNKTDL